MPDQTQTALPAPPSIPASNASYNKIADRLYKAAQAGNKVAVTYTRDSALKGSNTYCKMLRRYADEVLAVIDVPAPVEAPKAKAKKKVAA